MDLPAFCIVLYRQRIAFHMPMSNPMTGDVVDFLEFWKVGTKTQGLCWKVARHKEM